MHVRDDHGPNAVRPNADGLESARQLPRLAEGAGRARVDQDPPLAILDEILVEHEADAAGLGRERGAGGLLDLLRRAAREVGKRHIGIAVAQRRYGEAADLDLDRRNHRLGLERSGPARRRFDRIRPTRPRWMPRETKVQRHGAKDWS
jgi:hypothetical protein